MRGERSVEDEDDLDDDAVDCAFEIGEAVERGDLQLMSILATLQFALS